MTVLFVADLHLDESRPQVSAAFFELLQKRAVNAEALYILGDLFEVWIGDDDDAELAVSVRSALRELSDAGTRVYLQHGNRDFMLGDEFARAAGAEFVGEGDHIELPDGVPTIVLHGDSLCTLDSDYMLWRIKSRAPEFREHMLSLPLPERRKLVADLRSQSMEANSNKAEDIMDVTPAAVTELLAEQNALRMIHGHTHRPAVHDLQVNGKTAQRIVLGDWEDDYYLAIADPSGCRLEQVRIA